MRWSEDAVPGHPYWWPSGHSEPESTDAPTGRTDILVIGAGYTGLSAALHAHDAGARVAVVDAGRPGQGASTRNGGMFGAHPRLGLDALRDTFGAPTGEAIFAEAQTALDFVRALIAREGIDCDLQDTGRITLAWTAAQFEAQKRLAGQIAETTSVEAQIVERADLGREIDTGRYFGGLLFPDHGAIHPRKLHQGLLAAVRARAIPVLADCPVTAWTRTTRGYLAETPRGGVRADKLVLATNGYTTRAFSWARRRVFALTSFIIATEPLDPALISRLAPGRRMMVETRARHSYFRISPDGTRILWGGRASMRPLDIRLAASRLRQSMLQVWPDLAGVALTHAWTGNTGFSFAQTPSVGERDGLHYAMGYSGSGTVMAPYLGAKAGLRAAGAPGAETAFAGLPMATSWMNPTGTPWFLYGADLWFRYRVDPAEWAARHGT